MTQQRSLVEIDHALLGASMWHKPFLLHHNLTGHPLVSRDAVVRLVSERPPWSVHYGCSDQPVVREGPGAVPQVTALDAATDIEHSASWIVLSFVDHVPAYGELLDQTSGELRSVLAATDGPARARTGTIFMSSPKGVAPAHMDRHHNILLQVEGTKELSVGELDDEVVFEQEIYRHFAGHEHLLRLPTRFETFTIGPGEGVYIPPYRPHWIVCHDDVALALSCSVRTARSHRTELAHTFNSKLRRLGVRPRMAGARGRLDAAKAVAVTARRRARRTN